MLWIKWQSIRHSFNCPDNQARRGSDRHQKGERSYFDKIQLKYRYLDYKGKVHNEKTLSYAGTQSTLSISTSQALSKFEQRLGLRRHLKSLKLIQSTKHDGIGQQSIRLQLKDRSLENKHETWSLAILKFDQYLKRNFQSRMSQMGSE